MSTSLQRKLLDRELRQPLETSLVAEDGVSAASLALAFEELLGGGSALLPLLQPHAQRLGTLIKGLTLHPVAQLLLRPRRPRGLNTTPTLWPQWL